MGMMMLAMRASTGTDQGFTGIAVDILIDCRDRNVDIFKTVKDRTETIFIIIESQPGMVFAHDQFIAAIVFCQECIEHQLIVAGKDIRIFKGDNDDSVSGQKIVDKAIE